MVKKTINRLLKYRHFWREVNFDELSQLYISMMFRNMALSLVGIFIPVYLYSLGFSLTSIMLFYGIIFASRMFWDFGAGFLVARYGPKHTMAISYIFQIASLAMITTLESLHWPIGIIAILFGMANSIFFVSYHVDFSKIKDSKHGGKELGYMNIIERLGATIGPVIGGIVATLFGAEFTFLFATIFIVVGLVPLFMTGEPVRINQTLKFNKFKAGPVMRDMVASAGNSLSHTMNVSLWPLYILIVIISGQTYLTIGGLASLSAISVIVVAFTVGRLIDKKRGRNLLRAGSIASALLHLARPFIGSLGGATVVTAGQELAETSARMPFTKGIYDAADSHPGYRIVYIVTIEAFASLAKTVAYFLLAIVSVMLPQNLFFATAFLIASFGALLIMTERFHALDRAKV